MNTLHTFHIPVMGLAYTVDTPIKVSHLGITSVMSIVDDFLIEKVRNYYSEKYSIAVQVIDRKDKEARAEIITSYLNLVEEIVENKWHKHIRDIVEDKNYRDDYFELLPDSEYWKNQWQIRSAEYSKKELTEWAKLQFKPGSIDVNVMTKVDLKNYQNGQELPTEYNNAHVALRGFAKSKLGSSIVLSAGMNPSLYSYMQNFDDFIPDKNGNLKKKITIKVSDYRSALIQGKMLAKKGLWVSEFRIESGLNCGGHAFPTQGNLLGPILEEFKIKRVELYKELLMIWQTALRSERGVTDSLTPELKVSVQGGVGTHHEHDFLRKHYQIDSVGWGSPFLLVPEAVSIDDETLNKLSEAKENDIYLSNASPIGFPFYNIKSSSRQKYQKEKIRLGKPGSPCTKKYLRFNTEFEKEGLCTASRQYIKMAIAKLESENLSEKKMEAEKQKLYEKECLCCGLALPFLIEQNLNKKMEGKGVTVCPGPNLAYFEGVFPLRDMIKHIYGKINLITRTDRPNMFIKELQLYINYLSDRVSAYNLTPDEKTKNYLSQFIVNLKDGLNYYRKLFSTDLICESINQNIQNQLNEFLTSIENERKKILDFQTFLN